MLWGRLSLKCDAHAHKPDFIFRRNGRVHLHRRGRQFSRLLAAEVCASAVAIVMLDSPSSEVVWRVLATHSIRQFPLQFPSRASPCAITFPLDSTAEQIHGLLQFYICAVMELHIEPRWPMQNHGILHFENICLYMFLYREMHYHQPCNLYVPLLYIMLLMWGWQQKCENYCGYQHRYIAQVRTRTQSQAILSWNCRNFSCILKANSLIRA